MVKPLINILYSFRRCPYAIRARMAIFYSGISVDIREVLLANKPSSMLEYSPKASVPVLVLTNGRVIDESLDIMSWALLQSDPDEWMPAEQLSRDDTSALIQTNDSEFKTYLDRYKYATRYPEHPQYYYRQQGEAFLQRLDDRLQEQGFLLGAKMSLADVAIFPFIRQFALVDMEWFESSDYQALCRWLKGFMVSSLFMGVMQKYPQWHEGEEGIPFP